MCIRDRHGRAEGVALIWFSCKDTGLGVLKLTSRPSEKSTGTQTSRLASTQTNRVTDIQTSRPKDTDKSTGRHSNDPNCYTYQLTNTRTYRLPDTDKSNAKLLYIPPDRHSHKSIENRLNIPTGTLTVVVYVF